MIDPFVEGPLQDHEIKALVAGWAKVLKDQVDSLGLPIDTALDMLREYIEDALPEPAADAAKEELFKIDLVGYSNYRGNITGDLFPHSEKKEHLKKEIGMTNRIITLIREQTKVFKVLAISFCKNECGDGDNHRPECTIACKALGLNQESDTQRQDRICAACGEGIMEYDGWIHTGSPDTPLTVCYKVFHVACLHNGGCPLGPPDCMPETEEKSHEGN